MVRKVNSGRRKKNRPLLKNWRRARGRIRGTRCGKKWKIPGRSRKDPKRNCTIQGVRGGEVKKRAAMKSCGKRRIRETRKGQGGV